MHTNIYVHKCTRGGRGGGRGRRQAGRGGVGGKEEADGEGTWDGKEVRQPSL